VLSVKCKDILRQGSGFFFLAQRHRERREKDEDKDEVKAEAKAKKSPLSST
jgi:hypothetical protein